MSSPTGVCSFPQKIISGVCFGVKSMVDRGLIVVKLQTIPCNIEFAFGISFP